MKPNRKHLIAEMVVFIADMIPELVNQTEDQMKALCTTATLLMDAYYGKNELTGAEVDKWLEFGVYEICHALDMNWGIEIDPESIYNDMYNYADHIVAACKNQNEMEV